MKKLNFTLAFLFLFLISFSSVFGQKTKPKGGPAQWGSLGGRLILSGKHTFKKTTGRSDKKSGQIPQGKITLRGPGFLGYYVRKRKTVAVRVGWNAYDYPSNKPTNMAAVALGERCLLKGYKGWVWEPSPAVMTFVDPKTPNYLIDGRTVTLDLWVHAGDVGVHAQVYVLPEPVGIEYDIWFFPRKGGKVIKVVDVNGKDITNIDPIIVKPDPDPDPGNINVNLIADSHVYAYSYLGWNKANWGKYEFIGGGWNPTGGEKRAFLKFAFPGIKPNSVNKATLRLYHNHTGGGNAVDLGVYRVMSPWIEGRGTIKPATPAIPGEISWVNQPKIDKYPVIYFNPGKGVKKWVEIDVTPLVKSWLTGIPNHGMVIKGGEHLAGKPESQYGFHSRENKEIDKRPQLILNSNTGGGNINVKPGVSGLRVRADHREAEPKATVTVPVWLDFPKTFSRTGGGRVNVANLNVEISYNPRVVRPLGKVTKGNLMNNCIFQTNNAKSGVIKIGFATKGRVQTTGTLAQIPFQVIGQAGQVSPLSVRITTINDDKGRVPRATVSHGSIKILNAALPGDINDNGFIDAGDALCALKMSVDLMKENLILNVDKQNGVTSNDARLLLKMAAKNTTMPREGTGMPRENTNRLLPKF